MKESTAAFSGRVRSIVPGIYYMFPGSLVEIEIDEDLKESDKGHLFSNKAVKKYNRRYIFFPSQGDFELLGTRLCMKNESLPKAEVGDYILAFPFVEPAGFDEMIYLPILNEVVIERQDGSLSIGGDWRRARELTKARSIVELKAAFRREASIQKESNP